MVNHTLFYEQQETYFLFLVQNRVCAANSVNIKNRTPRENLYRYDCGKCETSHYLNAETRSQIFEAVNSGKFLRFHRNYGMTTNEFGIARVLFQKENKKHNKFFDRFLPHDLFHTKPTPPAPEISETSKFTRVTSTTELAPGVLFPEPATFPSDFIVPPETVHPDLLVEYFYCGRKRRFEQAVEALTHSDSSFAEDSTNSVYLCKYGNHYHIGRAGSRTKKQTTYRKDVSNGLRWYVQDPRRANRFMWAVMNFG